MVTIREAKNYSMAIELDIWCTTLMNIKASNEEGLEIQQSNNACISFGLNILIASGGKKHQSPVMKLMGSIRAGKLYLIISLTLSCWQLQNTQRLPLLLGCSLSTTYLWPGEGFYYLSTIDLSVQTIILPAQWCLELGREAWGRGDDFLGQRYTCVFQ